MAKVLIIDDEEIIRQQMQKLLALDDYETFTAEDGQKGLEIHDREQPEIALVDVKMPGMDGIEVLKRIKDRSTATEVIIITGHGGIETAIDALKLGAFSYLQKPIEYDELEIEIERALEKQEMQKQLDNHVQALKEAHDKLEPLYAQLQREHEIAKQVFANVIRTDYIEFPQMKYLLWPMEIVSGDLLLVSPKSPDGMYVFLGDFTGHGLSAAIGAIPVTDVFYAMTAKNASVADIVAEINSKLKGVLPTGMFCCACVMELDHGSGRLTVWNGGMPDVLVTGGQAGIKHRLPFHAPALGVVGSHELELDVETIELTPGDRVYAYSDGLTEMSNPDGEMFGRQRIEEGLIQDDAGDNIFDDLKNSFEDFRKDAPQSDDLTLIEVTYGHESPMGWKMNFTFNAESLRTIEVTSYLRKMIENDQWLQAHTYNINIILSELIANALDWGVLGLDSDMKKDPEGFEEYIAVRQKKLDTLTEGWIKVELEHAPSNSEGRFIVQVEDSGLGFDHSQSRPQHADNTSLRGRGIRMTRDLCQKVAYQGRGNRVKAVYVCS